MSERLLLGPLSRHKRLRFGQALPLLVPAHWESRHLHSETPHGGARRAGICTAGVLRAGGRPLWSAALTGGAATGPPAELPKRGPRPRKSEATTSLGISWNSDATQRRRPSSHPTGSRAPKAVVAVGRKRRALAAAFLLQHRGPTRGTQPVKRGRDPVVGGETMPPQSDPSEAPDTSLVTPQEPIHSGLPPQLNTGESDQNGGQAD